MWNFLLGFLFARANRRLSVHPAFALDCPCSDQSWPVLIYTAVVFHALTERNRGP